MAISASNLRYDACRHIGHACDLLSYIGAADLGPVPGRRWRRRIWPRRDLPAPETPRDRRAAAPGPWSRLADVLDLAFLPDRPPQALHPSAFPAGAQNALQNTRCLGGDDPADPMGLLKRNHRLPPPMLSCAARSVEARRGDRSRTIVRCFGWRAGALRELNWRWTLVANDGPAAGSGGSRSRSAAAAPARPYPRRQRSRCRLSTAGTPSRVRAWRLSAKMPVRHTVTEHAPAAAAQARVMGAPFEALPPRLRASNGTALIAAPAVAPPSPVAATPPAHHRATVIGFPKKGEHDLNG